MAPTQITPPSPVPAEVILPLPPADRELPAEQKDVSSLQLPQPLDEGPFGMALIDLQFRIMRVNKALCRLLGYSQQELESLCLPDITCEQDIHNCSHLVEQALAGTPHHAHIDKRFIKKNGEILWVQFAASVIRDDRGVPVCSLAVIEEITERKKAEETLQLTSQKLEARVDQLEEISRGMGLLAEMGETLRACLTMEEAYRIIVEIAQRICPVKVGVLYVFQEARNMFESVAEWGDASLLERAFALDECWALRRARAHWVGDTRTGLLCKHVGYPPPEAYLCVPMMVQQQPIGVLHLAHANIDRMPEAKQRLALAMADHVAIALSNLQLHESLRSQLIRDGLSGLFTLSFMEESLDLELSRSLRNQKALGLIEIELDHFDIFCKTFGRDAAMAVIRELGGLLQANIRKEDVACRSSDRRFLIVLPLSSLDITRQRAEHLRTMIRNLQMHHRGNIVARVTVSIGVAVFPEHGRTVDALLQAADGALNSASKAGGDTVVVAR